MQVMKKQKDFINFSINIQLRMQRNKNKFIACMEGKIDHITLSIGLEDY
jgi:hypothetical protein